jgi:hypothetical protein
MRRKNKMNEQQKDSQVQVEMKKLDDIITLLKEMTEELENALTCVVTDVTKEPSTSSVAEELVPLAGALRGYNWRIKHSIGIIVSLHARLEL